MKRAFIAVLLLALVIFAAGCGPSTVYQTFSNEELDSKLCQFCDLVSSLGYEISIASQAAAATTTTSAAISAPAAFTLSQSRWTAQGRWSGPDAEGWYSFSGIVGINGLAMYIGNIPITQMRIRSAAAGRFEVEAGYPGVSDTLIKASYEIAASGKLSGSITASLTVNESQSGTVSAAARMVDSWETFGATFDFSDLTAVAIEDPEAKAGIADNMFVGRIDFHQTHQKSQNGTLSGPENSPVAHLVSSVNKKEDNIQYLEFGEGSWYDKLEDDPDAGQISVVGTSSAIAM